MENPDIIATDDDGNELENTEVAVNGEVPGGGDGSGAPESATYVTTDDEDDLENATQHSDLSGADLHAPQEHGDEAHGEIDAKTWDGYEAYVQDTEPSTDEPYIRFELE